MAVSMDDTGSKERATISEPAEPSRIIVCRNVPGNHPGGTDCWCLPYVLDPDDDVAYANLMDLCEHPERQVDG